jgi:hypothetical protein
VKNTVTVTGRLKNIKQFDQYGLMVVGQLTQKNGIERAKFTIPIVTMDPAIASQLVALGEFVDDDGRTVEVEIEAELSTKFDVRRGVEQADRKAPLTRLLVKSVAVV